MAYKNGQVYLGTFGAGSDSYAYCYTPIYNKAKNTYFLKYNYKFYLPSYTQGFSLTDYKGKLRMFASISYGRNETKGIYCSYLYTYTFNQSNGSKTLDNIYINKASLFFIAKCAQFKRHNVRKRFS